MFIIIHIFKTWIVSFLIFINQNFDYKIVYHLLFLIFFMIISFLFASFRFNFFQEYYLHDKVLYGYFDSHFIVGNLLCFSKISFYLMHILVIPNYIYFLLSSKILLFLFWLRLLSCILIVFYFSRKWINVDYFNKFVILIQH